MSHIEVVTYLVFVFYVLSFLALSHVTAKASGRRIWLFNDGPRQQRLSALLFRIAFFVGAIWPMVRAIGGEPIRADPVAGILDGTGFDLLGHFLVTVGACVAIVSQLHMGNSWRIGASVGEQGAIVDTGPFAISRNPVFVGQVLLFVGLFLVLPGIVQGVFTLAILIAVRLQVGIEEAVLRASLGKPYLDYLKRVRRWIGTVPQSTAVQDWSATSGMTRDT